MATKLPATFRYTPSERELQQLCFSAKNLRGANAFLVASAAFRFERERLVVSFDSLTIPICDSTALSYDLPKLAQLLQSLFEYVLSEQVRVKFETFDFQESFEFVPKLSRKSTLCLFSGGVDSYCGLLVTKRRYPGVEGIFCGHADHSRTNQIIERLEDRIFQPAGVNIRHTAVARIGAQGYSQLRGFLYAVTTGYWLQAFSANRLVITECGPTMYQPRFGPFDAVTMTTNPIVLGHAVAVLDLLLGRQIDVIVPFEDMTKAEVFALTPEPGAVRLTHSCISQRFGDHDGTCYGCVIRRLGALAAKVRDVEYRRDPLTDETADQGNLLALLVFCQDLLIDFQSLDDYERQTIDSFGKLDLFRRFALDNYAAVHRLILSHRRVTKAARTLYREVVDSIGTDVLDSRLATLADRRKTPAFNRTVQPIKVEG